MSTATSTEMSTATRTALGAYVAPPPQERLLDLLFAGDEVLRMRPRVRECVTRAGLDEPRRSDFLLAVHEVACNAVEHGGGAGRLLLYRSDGALHCRVSDNGPGFTEEAVPAEPPGLLGGEGGRGLWLTKELTDRLHITAGPVGAVVTVAMCLG